MRFEEKVIRTLEEKVGGLNNRVLKLERKVAEEEKYPMKQGERIMYAILGTGGGIYGFSQSISQAIKIRDICWNIGQRKPKKYIVSFREV